MDDQATLKTYGNPELSEDTKERQLVTFALFAYNQEKCSRQAVKVTFPLAYSLRENALSDDCSPKGAFEIMEKMAKGQKGSYLVTVRRASAKKLLPSEARAPFRFNQLFHSELN
ncbi:hypothetical protein [Thioclava sp. IC9]|uniref:hypothetical protein n=1 Tax=Thioclava sp. IC9 TaxID=1973007 RepID=UPI000B53BC36|nr:hypothetical protein [Thioclava sp. IC9]OWX98817.1 hypothetical protein B6V76_18565 [Thioclava sp. IC9]